MVILLNHHGYKTFRCFYVNENKATDKMKLSTFPALVSLSPLSPTQMLRQSFLILRSLMGFLALSLLSFTIFSSEKSNSQWRSHKVNRRRCYSKVLRFGWRTEINACLAFKVINNIYLIARILVLENQNVKSFNFNKLNLNHPLVSVGQDRPRDFGAERCGYNRLGGQALRLEKARGQSTAAREGDRVQNEGGGG